MVLGGLPERGQVAHQIGEEWPDANAHPLDQEREHVKHSQLKHRNTVQYNLRNKVREGQASPYSRLLPLAFLLYRTGTSVQHVAFIVVYFYGS